MSHTPGPWHVNAIDSKLNRITGDESSSGWDKLQINSLNRTVATVYRSYDARLIASAPLMRAALEAINARINGEYDHPSLILFGPLSTTLLDDIARIAVSGLPTPEELAGP